LVIGAEARPPQKLWTEHRQDVYFWSVTRHGTIGLLVAVMCTIAAAAPKVDRIVVLKKEHKLLLLSEGEPVKLYRVALGSGGMAPKRQQGDHRTPEGSYRIDWRNPASRFHLALHISYPNEADKDYARKLGVDPGGDIMIHGLADSFKELEAAHRISDWTDGCIAVTDAEIEEIWKLVPDGTPVEILP